ncbi:hypothetical protein [Methylopila sp. M107]|uniref:hypothetical protein n=1 Tax=Methylopila sp. M107 TaxID=1101190 RepID=UPI000366E709|nr:hypothetical protein [Methylopila sp. M107]
MTYRLVEQYTFKRTVEIRRPSEDVKDKVEVDTFTAVFRTITPAEIEEFEDRLANSKTAKDTIKLLTDFAVRVTQGWEEVADAAGHEAVFSEETFRHHLQITWFRDGVIAAYRAAIRGDEARLGN